MDFAAGAAARSPAPRRVARRLAFCLGLAMASAAAGATSIEHSEIRFEGSRFRYSFVTVIDGAPDAVRQVVTDYDNLDRINRNVILSRVLERYDDGTLKRALFLERCVLGICFDIRFVERVVEEGYRIRTEIIPAESNFERGEAEWLIEALPDGRTRMTLRADQTPEFWIPPVIGPFVLTRVFRYEVTHTCEAIEQLVADAGP